MNAHVLLEGLIDYAGLFPPASLDMAPAVKAYAEYRAGGDSGMLGRFILPASRLDEFAAAATPFLEASSSRWRLSAIVADNPAKAREAIQAFNSQRTFADGTSLVVCDSVELPVKSPDEISAALDAFPLPLEVYLEIPLQPDPTVLIAKISNTRARAKIRTGGVVASAIPGAEDIVRFIRVCSEHRVPFKATAGLHHAMRGSYPLTYDANSPRGTMYGYLNIFLAAAFLEAGMDDVDLVQFLEETDPAALTVDDAGVRWRSFSITTDELGDTRQLFALSFGSCSFVEPVSEAKELNLL
ncbi:MAG: hypothetical protein ABI556_01125 [Gemmatimonadales bacterium]